MVPGHAVRPLPLGEGRGEGLSIAPPGSAPFPQPFSQKGEGGLYRSET